MHPNSQASALEVEYAHFRRLQPQLQQQHPEGGFVAIKHGEVLGVWADKIEASFGGLARGGENDVLVVDIFLEEAVPPAFIPYSQVV